MFFAKLLITLIILITVKVIEAQTQRSCAQCIAGNFGLYRNLMQDSSVGQSMGWVDQWTGTDCINGRINNLTCYHACLKITLVLIGSEQDLVEGFMMDCSDGLIYASPDLPQGVDYKKYDGNNVFSNRRRNITITYEFTMESSESAEKVREAHSSVVVPSSIKLTYQTSTIVIIVFLGLLVISTVIGICVALIRHCFFPRKHKDDDHLYNVTFHKVDDATDFNEQGPSAPVEATQTL